MGWRPDEVWLDTDVLWFREKPREPFAVLSLTVPAFVSGGLEASFFVPAATGLEASRQRRLARQAARRRRLLTRTVPAVALVLGSATMLPIAALRQGSGTRDPGPLQADPPSLAFRLDDERVARGTPGSRAGASSREPAARTVVREKALVRVEWHRATSVGLPYAGRLVDGTQLPVEGR